MANYIKATNFAVKDTLTTGDPAKIIKGTEIDTEYTAIAAAITSKADSESPTFTGTPSAPTAGAGTNNTQLATTAFVGSAITTAIGGLNTGVTTVSAGTTGLTPSTPTAGAVVLGGTLALTNGGTGGTTASDARTNLGLGALAVLSSVGSSQISSSAVGTSQLANSAVTGAKLSGAQSGSAPVYGARAWVRFSATGAPTISTAGSGNVSSVSYLSTGSFQVNFSTSMPNSNYSVVSSFSNSTTGQGGSTYPILASTGNVTLYSVGIDGLLKNWAYNSIAIFC